MAKEKVQFGGTNQGKKRQTICTRLMIRIVALVVFMLAVTITLAINRSGNIVTTLSQDTLNHEADAYENQISGWVSEILATLDSSLCTLKAVPFESDQAELGYLKQTMSLNENLPTGIYVGGSDGTFLDPSGFVPDSSYVVREREWFVDGIKNETMQFGAPYIDAETGAYMVSASAQIDSKTVAAADVNLETIANVVENISVMNSGYAFLVDNESQTIIAHHDADFRGQSIDTCNSSFIQEVASHSGDTSDTVYEIADDGTDYMVTIGTIDGTTWSLVCAVESSVVFASLRQLQIILILIAIVMIIIGCVILVWQIRKTTAPIITVNKAIDDMTNGDFSINVPISGNDEITTMSENLSGFIGKMRRTIGELTSISEKLNYQSGDSTELSDGMSNAANMQSESMRQLKETVDELANSIQEIAESATSLAMTVSDVNENAAGAKEQMQSSVVIANEGKSHIEDVSVMMKSINETILQLDVRVREVGTSTEEINNITDIIGNIAAQTNLLALNASIEAARAGEAGKGFAVVATEIGKLANMCAESAEHITGLVKKVNNEVNQVINQTKESVSDITESQALVAKTAETFENIYNNIIETDKLVEEVTYRIQKVDEVATNMASITEEQSASTEEILATSEELYVHATKIADNSNKVHEISSDLGVSANNIDGHMKEFQI